MKRKYLIQYKEWSNCGLRLLNKVKIEEFTDNELEDFCNNVWEIVSVHLL